MELHAKLMRLCERRRLTNQRQLAAMIRVSKSSLNRWLSGGGIPDLHEGLRLARALEVPLEYLADDAMDEPEEAQAMVRAQDLPEDVKSIVKVYTALKPAGLTEEEAIRRLVGEVTIEPMAPPTPRGTNRRGG